MTAAPPRSPERPGGGPAPDAVGTAAVAFGAAAAEPAAPADVAVRRSRSAAFGTWVELLVLGTAADLDAAAGLLAADLVAVDRACSRFRADSELAQLPEAAGRPVAVSPLLADLVAVALRAAAQTDGDVDPTLGRSLVAAGYDGDLAGLAADGPPVRPVPARTGAWREVELDPVASTLRVPADVVLDLGATAKARAADRAAARIARVLDIALLVNLGGDLAVGGRPEQQPAGGWPVRVTLGASDPRTASSDDGPVVHVSAGGVATSSTVLRRWRRGGAELHHVLDPRTGLPAEPVWRLVTVAAATCVDANTASTAAVVRGRSAPAWLESLGLPARLVGADGTVVRVAGWPAEVSAR